MISSQNHCKGLPRRFPHRNRKLCIVISKKTRLNCSPYQQRSLHRYIEKDMTEPFSNIRLTFMILSKINSSLLQDEKTVFIPTSYAIENTASVYVTKGKTEPFSIPTDWTVAHLNTDLGVVTSKKTKLNRSPSQQKNLHYYSHLNTELGVVTSNKTKMNRSPSQQKTLHCYFEKEKTELFAISTKKSSLIHRKRGCQIRYDALGFEFNFGWDTEHET